jgi:hypothetical protein
MIMKYAAFWVSVCCGVLLLVILSAPVAHARGGAYYFSYYSGAKYHEAVRRITTPTFTLNRVKKIEKKLYHRNKKKPPYLCLEPGRCTFNPLKYTPYGKKKTNRSRLSSPYTISTIPQTTKP